jgi:mono/diheme cytochrome c family protein
MISSVRQWPLRDQIALFALASIFLLLGLLLFFPPDGVQRSDWAQFIGGFHLLTIHFPIALILLIPFFEIAGRSRHFSHMRSTVDLILPLAAFSAIAAAILGWFLARSGGSTGPIVAQHMWGGFFVSVVCWLCWVLRGRLLSQRLHAAYIGGLVIAVSLVSWTGYRGGQLSHGDSHLMEHIPNPVRNWLGLSQEKTPTAATPDSFFIARVEPIFAQRCISCHGPSKHKAGLRLDTYEAVIRGGKSGPAVKAGDSKKSALLQRISLPSGSDKIMPPDGKPTLSPDQVRVIALWISAGASPTLAANAIQGAPTTIAQLVAEVTFAGIDTAAVAKQRAPLAETLVQLQKRYPGIVEYEARDSALLAINASLMGSNFGDDDLAQLTHVYDWFSIADFSNTAITDRSAPNIAAMKRLRVLRLMRTKISDATVLGLGGLNELESLSVFGTRITPASLTIAEHLPKLQHLYVGETKITASVQLPDALKSKLLF